MGVALATITGEDQWTSPTLSIKGMFNFSVWGEGSATVTLQRSSDEGATWLDTDSLDENTSTTGTEPEHSVFHRAGVKTGDYTRGSKYIRLSQ